MTIDDDESDNITLHDGHGVNAHNGPFAAGAIGGMILAVASYSHVSGRGGPSASTRDVKRL